MKGKEYWVIIPTATEKTAKAILEESGYKGIIIEKPIGTYRTEKNFRVR